MDLRTSERSENSIVTGMGCASAADVSWFGVLVNKYTKPSTRNTVFKVGDFIKVGSKLPWPLLISARGLSRTRCHNMLLGRPHSAMMYFVLIPYTYRLVAIATTHVQCKNSTTYSCLFITNGRTSAGEPRFSSLPLLILSSHYNLP